MDSDPESSGSSRMIMEKREVSQIDMLPDDVLLQIFYFYVRLGQILYLDVRVWETLVHVCRRWRGLVFQSPRHLDLQLYCTPETPAYYNLDIWPAFPLVLNGQVRLSTRTHNIIAVLEQTNRVRKVDFWNIEGLQFENLLAAMQVPFPELTDLHLSSFETLPVIPDSFLGGSFPSLQYLHFNGIPFPGLPKPLSSANHLFACFLSDIPHSGYFSPEAIVAAISPLPTLCSLSLKFRSPQSRPDRQSRPLPPPIRFALPLRTLEFGGVTEYLEDLVTRIDTPELTFLHIIFFNQIDFDCPRLVQFINRTPILRALVEAHVQFNHRLAEVIFRYRTSYQITIGISCRDPDWQLSFIEQICNSCLPSLSTTEFLYIELKYLESAWENDGIENTLWLQLFLPFTMVKSLYLDTELAPDIAAALQELVGGMIAEVLPSLENIFVKGLEASRSLEKDIGKFVAARQLSGHSITISVWE